MAGGVHCCYTKGARSSSGQGQASMVTLSLISLIFRIVHVPAQAIFCKTYMQILAVNVTPLLTAKLQLRTCRYSFGVQLYQINSSLQMLQCE